MVGVLRPGLPGEHLPSEPSPRPGASLRICQGERRTRHGTEPRVTSQRRFKNEWFLLFPPEEKGAHTRHRHTHTRAQSISRWGSGNSSFNYTSPPGWMRGRAAGGRGREGIRALHRAPCPTWAPTPLLLLCCKVSKP